jgi:hypothetical protein
MSSSDYPPIVAGFVEGLLAPIFELVFCVLVTALNAVSSATGSPNLALFVALLSIMDIVRNIALGLSHSQFAIGNAVGNVFGLFLFYGAISSVSNEAANNSLLLTVILVVSLVIGIVITFWGRDNQTY